jgi:hypothetical protein
MQKLDVLREHCEREGRDYDSIEKTTAFPMRIEASAGPGPLLELMRGMHELGFTVAYVTIADPDPLPALERLGTGVIPEISSW